VPRKRISLSMRLHDEVTSAVAKPATPRTEQKPAKAAARVSANVPAAADSAMGSAFADAFAKLKK